MRQGRHHTPWDSRLKASHDLPRNSGCVNLLDISRQSLDDTAVSQVIVGTVPATSHSLHQTQGVNVQASDILEFTLYRGPCLGECPVFEFIARRDGTYSFNGKRYIEPLGVQNGQFYEFLFDRLAAVCLELLVLELEDNYHSDFDDVSSLDVWVKHTGGHKKISCDGGDVLPTRLWAMAELIEVTMREAMRYNKQRQKRK